MPQIINQFSGTSPLGQMISQLGQQMFGDAASGEIKRQQAYALQRGNTETDNLMRQIAQAGGVQANGADPITQAMLIGSGYDPADFARIGLMGAATQYGARAPETTNWTVGAGLPYGNTAQAFDLNLGEDRRWHDMQDATDRYGVDVGAETDRYGIDTTNARLRDQWTNEPLPAIDPVTGQPVFTTQGDTDGFTPVLSDTEVQGTLARQLFGPTGDGTRDEQLAYLGAEPGAANAPTVKNYRAPDGTTQLVTDESLAIGQDINGAPLIPGGQLISTSLQGGAEDIGLPTNATQTGIQRDEIAIGRFNVVANMMQELVDDPSTLWGPAGFAQQKIQELVQGVGGVVNLIRPQDEEAVRAFLPELYDPNIQSQQMLGTLMVYMAASALAGQDGRAVSDKDINLFRGIVPNPFGLFTSRETMRTALSQIQSVLAAYSDLNRRALTEGVVDLNAPAGAAPAAPATNDNAGTTFTDENGVTWELKDWNGDGVPVWGHE